jgi:hypothetical protein
MGFRTEQVMLTYRRPMGDFAQGYSAAMMDPSTTPWDQSQKGSLREKEDYFKAVEGGSKTWPLGIGAGGGGGEDERRGHGHVWAVDTAAVPPRPGPRRYMEAASARRHLLPPPDRNSESRPATQARLF